MMKYKTLFFSAVFLLCLIIKSHAQLTVRAMQVPAPYNALNGTPKVTTEKNALAVVSSGAAIGNNYAENRSQVISGSVGDIIYADKGIIINYSVPNWVFLDRMLLSAAINLKIADDVNLQASLPGTGLPEYSQQTLFNLYQQDIDRLQNIWDALGTTCAWVSFQNYRATVNADVRYNPPVGGTIGLLREETGNVNFNNVSYDAIEGNPVRSTLMIYQK